MPRNRRPQPSRSRRRRLASRVDDARRNEGRRDRVQQREAKTDRLNQRIARLERSLKVAKRAAARRDGQDDPQVAERRVDLHERLAVARERRDRNQRRAAARRRPAPRRPAEHPNSRVAGRYTRPERRPAAPRPAPRQAEPQQRQAEVIRRKSNGEILIREDVPQGRRRQIYAELRKAGLI